MSQEIKNSKRKKKKKKHRGNKRLLQCKYDSWLKSPKPDRDTRNILKI